MLQDFELVVLFITNSLSKVCLSFLILEETRHTRMKDLSENANILKLKTYKFVPPGVRSGVAALQDILENRLVIVWNSFLGYNIYRF